MIKFFALIFLVLSIPLQVIIMILLFFSKGNGVLFKQKRVGINKETFTIIKYRTMHEGQIFKVGKLLRKLGLDELPQLVNIIRGDMAFVGPRPLTAYDINRLGWNSPNYEKRWSVLPGITGEAQLGKTCNANLSLERDLNYVKNKSLRTDLKIIFRSFLVPFIGKFTK